MGLFKSNIQKTIKKLKEDQLNKIEPLKISFNVLIQRMNNERRKLKDLEELKESYEPGKIFQTQMQEERREELYAGWKKAKALKSRSTTIYHASYTSSRGSQIATAGSTGLHLNGFGPLNTGSYTLKDAYDAKKGLALVGSGPGGKVAVYYNGFLSAQEYEDDVTITHNGTNVNIGRVYGRHIKTLEF